MCEFRSWMADGTQTGRARNGVGHDRVPRSMAATGRIVTPIGVWVFSIVQAAFWFSYSFLSGLYYAVMKMKVRAVLNVHESRNDDALFMASVAPRCPRYSSCYAVVLPAGVDEHNPA